eukprot:4666071-Prymnesium_polylepis.2
MHARTSAHWSSRSSTKARAARQQMGNSASAGAGRTTLDAKARYLSQLDRDQTEARHSDEDRQHFRAKRRFKLEEEAHGNYADQVHCLDRAQSVKGVTSKALPLLPNQREDEALHEIIQQHLLRALCGS